MLIIAVSLFPTPSRKIFSKEKMEKKKADIQCGQRAKTKRKRNNWRGPIYGEETVYAVPFGGHIALGGRITLAAFLSISFETYLTLISKV